MTFILSLKMKNLKLIVEETKFKHGKRFFEIDERTHNEKKKNIIEDNRTRGKFSHNIEREKRRLKFSLSF